MFAQKIHQSVFRRLGLCLSRSLLCGIVCLFCFAVSPGFVFAQPEKKQLSAGETIEAKLSGKNEIAYGVRLAAGEYIRIDVCSMGSSLLVLARNPDRSEASRWYVDRGFPQPIAWIARAGGGYEFSLRIPKGNYSEQTVSMKLASRGKVESGDLRQMVDASRALSDAAYLRQQETADSLSKSLGKYRETLQKWSGLKDLPLMRAYIQCQIGDLLAEMSEYDRALIEYNRAGTLDTERQLKARILNSIGYVYLHQHKFQEAATLFADALKISCSTGDRWAEALSRHNLGATYYYQEKNSEAQESLHEALKIRTSLNDDLGQAGTHLILGYCYHALKEIQQAQEHYG